MNTTLPDILYGRLKGVVTGTLIAPKVTLGYARVSTDRQELSLEAQTASIRRAAEYHQSGELSIFSDPDTSGSTEFARRDQGFELLKRAEEVVMAGTQVTVIVPKVDRLGRDVIDINQTVRRLEAIGVRILFLDINVDTRTAMGRAFMQIAAVFAELELARIRERIQLVLNQKRSNGLLTGTVTFGWNVRYCFGDGSEQLHGCALSALDRETRARAHGGLISAKPEDNLEEQKWLLHMLSRRQCGWPDGQIARELNQLGVKTKRAGQKLKLRSPGGNEESATERTVSGLWQAEQVATLLNSTTVQHWLQKIS